MSFNSKLFNSEHFANIKDDVRAACLEFIGTLFLLLGLGGVQAAAFSSQAATRAAGSKAGDQSINKVASIEQLTYIAISMGLSLLVSAWLFFRVTGGLFNPAVSTALLLVGAIKPVRFALYCFAQMLGGIVASALLLALLPGPFVVNTTPGPSTNLGQALFIEMFITAALCLAVLMLAAEKHHTTPLAPIGIGLTLLVCHLWAVPFTGAAMNTARAFGPAAVTEFPTSHWIYWLGPFLGSLLATGFYTLLKMMEYWRLNPEQDNPQAESPPNPARTLGHALQSVTSRKVDRPPQSVPTIGQAVHVIASRTSDTHTVAGSSQVHIREKNGPADGGHESTNDSHV